MGEDHWKVELNEFHVIHYEYKTNYCEELEMKYFLQQVGFIGKIRRIGGNPACKRVERIYSWVRCEWSGVGSVGVMKLNRRSWT